MRWFYFRFILLFFFLAFSFSSLRFNFIFTSSIELCIMWCWKWRTLYFWIMFAFFFVLHSSDLTVTLSDLKFRWNTRYFWNGDLLYSITSCIGIFRQFPLWCLEMFRVFPAWSQANTFAPFTYRSFLAKKRKRKNLALFSLISMP